MSGSNPEATSGNIVQDAAHGATEFHGSTHDVVYVRFLTEGMRYGVFTAYDKAGNKIEIKIAANLDRTPPPIPSNLEAFQYNKVRDDGTSVSSTSYKFGTIEIMNQKELLYQDSGNSIMMLEIMQIQEWEQVTMQQILLDKVFITLKEQHLQLTEKTK